MLRAMFGMGGSEIVVILIVALLFLGPDKLPTAAKQISKGIRDIKKQTRSLQQQIESDEQIGGAIRDLKSALRGDEPAPRPRPPKLPAPRPAAELAEGGAPALPLVAAAGAVLPTPAGGPADLSEPAVIAEAERPDAAPAEPAAPPRLTLPPVAGEPDPDGPAGTDDDTELAKLIRPAAGTVAKGSEPPHG